MTQEVPEQRSHSSVATHGPRGQAFRGSERPEIDPARDMHHDLLAALAHGDIGARTVEADDVPGLEMGIAAVLGYEARSAEMQVDQQQVFATLADPS